MTAPIELRLSPQKPRLMAGEGVVLDLEVRALVDVDLVSPELNRNRTTLRVDSRSGDGLSQVLTGIDYLRVHKVSPLSQIEDMFHADRGAQWTVAVEHLNYSAPLPAGRYAISLSYRYGDSVEDSVSTNAVEVEVTPAELGSVEYRWFGGTSARDVLASIWTASNPEGEDWFYQNADPKDPGAVQFVTRIGRAARRPGARPVLAHLNDVHALHFAKYVVWEQDGEVGFLKVHRGGRSGVPGFVRHGLTDARLIDPPLQGHDGGLRTLVLGTGANGQPAVSLVSVPSSSSGNAYVSSLKAGARQGLALWPAVGGATLVLLTGFQGQVGLLGAGRTGETLLPQSVEGLVLSQWMGTGTLGGCFREGDSLRAFTMDPQTPGAEPGIAAEYEMLRLLLHPAGFASAGIGPSGNVVLLVGSDRGWLVLDRGEVFEVRPPPGSSGTPGLIPAAGGLFVVHHDSRRGFIPELVGAPAPAPLV